MNRDDLVGDLARSIRAADIRCFELICLDFEQLNAEQQEAYRVAAAALVPTITEFVANWLRLNANMDQSGWTESNGEALAREWREEMARNAR